MVRLARYLVNLRDEASLSEKQVADIVALWNCLPDDDKQRVSYQPRHRERLLQGRFKARSKPTTDASAHPNMLLSFLFAWNSISRVACLIQMFCLLYFGTFQSTVLVWMALDRFFAICRPLYYHKYMQIPNILKFIIRPIMRNIILIVTIVTLAGKLSFCTTDEIDHCFCEHMALVQLACGDISSNNIVGLLAAFLIPTTDFVFISVSYLIILGSVFKSGKSHLKAINTCITHIIVMIFTLTFSLTAFMSYRIRNNFSSSFHVFLSTMYLLFPSCFNPIIYGVRTNEIREQFLKFMNKQNILPEC
ncbi:olfactory receptor 52K1-like [Hoplias malabaricus]|uniref:olfactory receptor 52K1-like n=1 Tax=Hoplias malabaricus TaxID=27720 RepID=UPI0034635186